jgi:hypothetical protein
MKINKFNNFIIESVINELILETNVVYKKEFIDTLKDLQNSFDYSVEKIASILLKIIGTDLDIVQNYIGLSDDVDKISFIPSNRVNFDKVKIVDGRVVDGGRPNVHQIIIDAKIPTEDINGELNIVMFQPNEYLTNNIINDWKLIGTYDMDSDTIKTNFNGYILYHLQNNDDPTKFTVAYKAKSDREDGIEPLLTNNTGKLKIGRYINRLLDLYFNTDKIERKVYSASDIEKFVNAFTSTMEFNKNALDFFEVVKGDDIIKWYYNENYAARTGQLGQSCMQYDKCKEYFGIYEENPEVCQLLILKDSTGQKIMGRALLWNTEDDEKYIDRVYTNKDSLLNLFDKWSEKNGYFKNFRNNQGNLKVKVKPMDYGQYPYMDTFIYYNIEDGILTIRPELFKRPYLILQNTNGDAERRD